MTWLNNIRITKLAWVITALLMIIGGVSVGASVTAIFGSDRVRATWADFDRQTARKFELLGQIRDALGYGGMIHQFKNYIIRQDRKRIAKIEAEFARVETALTDYGALNVSEAEKASLRDIGGTVAEYAEALVKAVQMTSRGARPRRSTMSS